MRTGRYMQFNLEIFLQNKISHTSLPDLMYILEKDFQTWLIRSVHINILLFKTKLKFTVLQPNCRKRLGLF